MFWISWLLSFISVFLFAEQFPLLLFLGFFSYWVKFIRKVIKGKVVSIDLFFLFFSIYLVMGVLFYSSVEVQDFLCKYIGDQCLSVSKYEQKILLVHYLIYLLPSYLSLIVNASPFSRLNLGYRGSRSLAMLTTFFVFLAILYSCYLLKITAGKYIFWSGIDPSYFNMLGWLVMVTSSLIVVSFNHLSYKKSLWFYVCPILLILILVMLHIRVYAAVIIFSLILNSEIRGFRFKLKHVLFLGIGFLGVVFQAVTRFQSFDYSDMYNMLFTVTGEFLLPHMSTYYLLIDPLEYLPLFGFVDLLSQSLPSSFRPEAGVYEFRVSYVNSGMDPWPIGGIFLIGQLNYFFGFLGFPFYCLICYLMYKMKSNLVNGVYSIYLLMIPPLFMILPRMEFWTARVCMLNLLIVVMLKLFLMRVKVER